MLSHWHKQRRNNALIQQDFSYWSNEWALGFLGWNLHVKRNHDTGAWPAKIQKWNDGHFIKFQRTFSSIRNLGYGHENGQGKSCDSI